MVSFTFWPLIPRERTPGTHRIGGLVDLKVDLDTAARRKIQFILGWDFILQSLQNININHRETL
jgi:hypothetical protein